VINFWAEAVKKTMGHQSWKKMVENIGDIPAYQGPEDFKKFVTSEVKRYRDIFTELNLLIK
jgi:tripartite-type tricarboxylate transporter receptor subunit TctC